MRSIAIISSQAFSLVNFRGPLIRDLAGAGVKVYALAPDYTSDLRQAVTSLGADPISCRLSRTGTNPIRDLCDLLVLTHQLRKIKPDATLCYFIKPVIYGSLASWMAGVAQRFSLIEGLGYAFVAPTARAEKLRRRAFRRVIELLYRFALSRNDRVIFLNSEDLGEFVQRRIVSASKAMQVAGCGVELDRFEMSPAVVTPITFLLTARMLREKGVLDFIEGARRVRARHPDVRFLLVGGTDVNPGSVSATELAGWAREGLVEWPGQVADVRPWIARSSVFVLPSYYREGLPRSTQEAMAMGRPVITTNMPGCRETVKDGVNGFLVPAHDVDALVDAMLRFVEHPEWIERFGKESRRMAETRFDVRKINPEIFLAMGIVTNQPDRQKKITVAKE